MDSLAKSIHIAFLGNPYHDTRVFNLLKSFHKKNISTVVTSFELNENIIKVKDPAINLIQLKKSSIRLFFYIKFYLYLFYNLLKHKADIYFAEDLYCLPVCVIVSKLRGKKCVYNSRELFGYLAGLSDRSIIQKLWYGVERTFIKMPNLILVTGDMDADFLKKEYDVDNIRVLRNLPLRNDNIVKTNIRKEFKIDIEKKILLYQGVLLKGRGLEIIINCMPYLRDCVLVILGDGELKQKCQLLVENKGLKDSVIFGGRKSQMELAGYTSNADLGLVLIENLSLSYYYALPNKIFEYINVGLPFICSDLPQMRNVVEKYNVGEVVDIDSTKKIVESINRILNNNEKYNYYRANCFKASDTLNWDNEFKSIENEILNL